MKKMLTTLIVITVAVVLFNCTSNDGQSADPMSVTEGYRQWTPIGGMVTGDLTGALGMAHAGENGWRKIYINDKGKSASINGEYPYPVGTVIVKEVYMDDNGQAGKQAAVTVMVKKKAGFDPENGDWNYLMQKTGSDEVMAGKMPMCISCHAQAEGKDYVFMNLTDSK